MFIKVRVKYIFQWKAQLLIIFRSSLSSTAEQLLSLNFEESDVSSAKILQIKYKMRPKTEPWRTPAKMFFQEGAYPFNTILCLQPSRSVINNFNKSQSIPYDFKLDIKRSCQTLSKAFKYQEKSLSCQLAGCRQNFHRFHM